MMLKLRFLTSQRSFSHRAGAAGQLEASLYSHCVAKSLRFPAQFVSVEVDDNQLQLVYYITEWYYNLHDIIVVLFYKSGFPVFGDVT